MKINILNTIFSNLYILKNIISKSNRLIVILIDNLVPKKFHIYLRYFLLKILNRLEPEMFFIEKILKSKKRFLDIGANMGIYSFYFRNKFEYIDAFEPINEVSYRLKALNLGKIKIHNLAISDKDGKLILNIPINKGKIQSGLASLEKIHSLCEYRSIKVKTIDSYYFDDVSLIKIDVEGHELSVLKGAIETVNRCKPIILAEIEQRHIKKDIKGVFSEFLNLNYDGYFLIKQKLIPIFKFDFKVHQERFLKEPLNNIYINNFIFIPRV